MLFTGMAGDIPEDFNTSVSDAEFSSTAINLERPILIPVHFFGSVCVSLFAVCVSIHHSCTPSSHPSIHPPTHTHTRTHVHTHAHTQMYTHIMLIHTLLTLITNIICSHVVICVVYQTDIYSTHF